MFGAFTCRSSQSHEKPGNYNSSSGKFLSHTLRWTQTTQWTHSWLWTLQKHDSGWTKLDPLSFTVLTAQLNIQEKQVESRLLHIIMSRVLNCCFAGLVVVFVVPLLPWHLAHTWRILHILVPWSSTRSCRRWRKGDTRTGRSTAGHFLSFCGPEISTVGHFLSTCGHSFIVTAKNRTPTVNPMSWPSADKDSAGISYTNRPALQTVESSGPPDGRIVRPSRR